MSEYLGWFAIVVVALVCAAGIVSLFVEFPDDILAPPDRKEK